MGTAFTALLKSGNPPEEYEKWISGDPSIPSHMCTLSGINFEDSHNIRTLVYSRLRKQKTVIDFYLKHIVFPREARNFEQKLSASGWDIARPRKYPLTGFSGTNDGRFTLPLEVTQKELNENLGTNAHVLDILLRPENNYYEYIPAEENKLETLLQHISSQQPPIRVIIDVGAQILLENAEVANRLLEEARRDHTGMSPEAVVYFENDNLVVQSVDGTTENLLFSPYARQLGKCFVYLDEAHTRGTDLKLPPKSRAAVTLGPKLTKDRLVQGTCIDVAGRIDLTL